MDQEGLKTSVEKHRIITAFRLSKTGSVTCNVLQLLLRRSCEFITFPNGTKIFLINSMDGTRTFLLYPLMNTSI